MLVIILSERFQASTFDRDTYHLVMEFGQSHDRRLSNWSSTRLLFLDHLHNRNMEPNFEVGERW